MDTLSSVCERIASYSSRLRKVTLLADYLKTLSDPDLVLQLGVAPNRIDVLMKIRGVSFATAWRKRLAIRYADQRVWMMDRVSLRRAKRAAGRPQDLLDLAALGSGRARR